jgi:hypothetical protein
MILIPSSYNNTSLQSTDFSTSFPRTQAQLQMSSQSGYVKRAGAPPVFTGKDFMPVSLTLEVLCLHDHQTLFETVNTLFDTKDETPRQLVCIDTEDANKAYYVYATPDQVMGGHDGPMAVVTLKIDDPIWQASTQDSTSWSITASTGEIAIVTGGNDYSYPILEITPTGSPSTDFIYTQYVYVLPRSDKPWASRPLALRPDGGTLDTAALVAAGKMQSDGDDLRVFRNGLEQNRWLSGMNTTDTKVWVVADIPEARNFLLKTAIGATDTVTEIEVVLTASSHEQINYMPNSGFVMVDSSHGATDSEVFSYTAKLYTDSKIGFAISTRAVEGTSAVAHSANANVRFMPYTYMIRYGSATAVAPDTVDTNKPIINLSTSSNATFVYGNFYNNQQTRASIFRPFVRRSDPVYATSTIFTSTDDLGDTDPSTVLGLRAVTYELGGVYRPDSVLMRWTASFPDYITSFAANGYKLETTTTIPSFGMAYSNFITGSMTFLWTLSAQPSTDLGVAWTAWSKATTDSVVPPNLDNLHFLASGSILGSSLHYAKATVEALTVNLTNYPHVAIGPEASTLVNMDCRFTNTLGEIIYIIYPMLVGQTLYIDTDPDFPTATYQGQVVNGAIKLSTIRAAWMRIAAGGTTLSFLNHLSASMNITVVIKWRDRANFF